jgi:hypothetical protein
MYGVDAAILMNQMSGSRAVMSVVFQIHLLNAKNASIVSAQISSRMIKRSVLIAAGELGEPRKTI